MSRRVPVDRARRIARWTIVVSLLASTTACLRQDTNAGVIIRRTPKATASPIAPGVYAVGQTAQTSNGNTVAVLEYEGPLPGGSGGLAVAAAEIEACASPQLTVRVAVARFQLELSDTTKRPSTASGPKSPALTDQVLRPGRCAQGWIHFEYRSDEKPAFVVFTTDPAIRWKIA